jgi:hypothetical protein
MIKHSSLISLIEDSKDQINQDIKELLFKINPSNTKLYELKSLSKFVSFI